MHFDILHLTHFRNYGKLSALFCGGINVITGNNGEGKTNVLEALHYLAMTRGWNSKSEKYALKDDEQYFIVEGLLRDLAETTNIQCNYLPPKGKKVLVNRKPLGKMSDHIGSIPIVAVLPSDTQLIDGGPSVRRRFMDSFISQHSPAYLQHLIQYEHALAQRNALLSLMAERRNWDKAQLAMWSEQLIGPGMAIVEERKHFIERFLPVFLQYFEWIVSDKETPTIQLDSQFVANTREEWVSAFENAAEKERYSLRSSVGIHKDDLIFEISGQAIRNYGSQGQQKTFVIALKLAQYALLAQLKSKAPILLLDDIFDKLDMHRLKAIAQILDQQVNGQVFITDTSYDRCEQVFASVKARDIKYFAVSNAELKSIEFKLDSNEKE